MLARAFGASLDRQLAAGRSPEATLLLASRAQDIVSLPSREAVAGNWEHLLRVARRSPSGRPAVTSGRSPVISGRSPVVSRRSPVIPVCGDLIAAAEPAIRELMRCLTVPLPVRAQGVAMASILLTDGAGPVYNRRGPVTLTAALEAAMTQLDPDLPLMQAAQGE